MRRIIGIDPGLAETGYGIIESRGSSCRCVTYGTIRTPADHEPGSRLDLLYTALKKVLADFGPGEAGIESLYFAKNISSAIPVAQARGVALLALARAGIPAGEYSPVVIKQAIVGSGRAEKLQVQHLVMHILGLPEIPKPDHAADALAVAICHLHGSHLSIVSIGKDV